MSRRPQYAGECRMGCGASITTGSKSGLCRACFGRASSSIGRKAGAVGRDKLVSWAESLKASLAAKQRKRDYRACEFIAGDVMLVSDVHVPMHCEETLIALCETAQRMAIKALVVVGDLCDFGGFSAHPKPTVIDAKGEMTSVNDVLADLLGVFETIWVVSGNHEQRIRYTIERAMNSRSPEQRILDSIEREDLEALDFPGRYVLVMEQYAKKVLGEDRAKRVKWLPQRMVELDGAPGLPRWRAIHQDNGSRLPPQEAVNHWQRWGQPIIMTHTHLVGARIAPNGVHPLVNLGCATREEWHEYKWAKPSGWPATVRGFAALREGRIALRWMSPYCEAP